MLALFLGIEKRKAELRLSELKGRKSRAVLHRYSLPLLIRMESIVTNDKFIYKKITAHNFVRYQLYDCHTNNHFKIYEENHAFTIFIKICFIK